ncbi:MAG: hypothetical protein ACKO96_02240 [Flammeovirgaceae bacterium]
MTKIQIKTSPLLVVWALATSCTSFVPLSYHGAGSSTTAKIEANEATMHLQHLDIQYQHLIFDLEVTNHNAYPVPVLPEQISYYFSATRFPLKQFNDVDSTTSVIRLRKKRFAKSNSQVWDLFQQKERSRATVGAIFTLVSVGLVLYDAAQDRKDNQKRHYTEKDVRHAATREAIVQAGLIAADIASQSAQQAQSNSYNLPFEIFTEGSIEALGKKRGKIFLPAEEMLAYLRIIIPFDNKEFVFDFKKITN